MNDIKMILVIGIVSLLGLGSYGAYVSASRITDLPKDGVLNSVLYIE